MRHRATDLIVDALLQRGELTPPGVPRVVVLADAFGQLREGEARVGDNRHRSPVRATELARVRVDPRERAPGAERQRLAAVPHQPGAHRERGVGAGEEVREGEDGLGEVVPIGEGAAPVGAHHDRCLEQLGDGAQLVPGARRQDATPGEDERRASLAEELRRRLEEGRVSRLLLRCERLAQADLGACLEDVGWDLDRDRARAPAPELAEGLVDDVGDVARRPRAGGPLGQVT